MKSVKPIEPDELELSEDVTDLFRRPSARPGLVISVRLTAEEADWLDDAAVAAGLNIVQFARQAILAHSAPAPGAAAATPAPQRRRTSRRGSARAAEAAPTTA
jgi:hypothetical protein